MPHSKGFSAVIVPSPSAPNPQPLTELKVSQSAHIIESFVEAIPFSNYRIYFTRSTPVEELEVYLAVILSEGGTPACKVYATGKGVSRSPSDSTWFLSGQLGSEVALDLTIKKCVELKLMRASVKPGVVLGNGELLVSDLSWIENEFVVFRWFWLTKEQISLFGLASDFKPYTNTTSVNEFLGSTNDLLISLLLPEQKIKFLEQIVKSPSTSIHLTEEQKESFSEIRKKLLVDFEREREERSKEATVLSTITSNSRNNSKEGGGRVGESSVSRSGSKSALKENSCPTSSKQERGNLSPIKPILLRTETSPLVRSNSFNFSDHPHYPLPEPSTSPLSKGLQSSPFKTFHDLIENSLVPSQGEGNGVEGEKGK